MPSASRPAPDRRTVLAGGTAGLLLFTLGGCDKLMTAREAREQGADFRNLTAQETRTLEAFGEVLVPGAAKAGIAHFVDANLVRPHAECLLTIRYLDVLPPYGAFYAAGLKALDDLARASAGKDFADLDGAAAADLVRPMLAGQMNGWNGPPAPLLYLAVRSDAADLVYGTPDAFERLGLPYVAHIEPPTTW